MAVPEVELKIPDKIKGTTFYPSVDAEGTISWTNDNYEINPKPVNIRGPVGPAGRDGVDGKPGRDGRDGVDGRPGRDGVDGQPGRDGKDGAVGPQGEQGIPGKDGATGPQGIQGPAGKGFETTNKLMYIGGVVNANPKKGDTLTLSTSDFNRAPAAVDKVSIVTYSDDYETASSIVCSIASTNERETTVQVIEKVVGGLNSNQVQTMIDDSIAAIPRLEKATW